MHAATPFEETGEFVPEIFLRDLRYAARRAEHDEVERLLAYCERQEGKGAFFAEALSWAARAYLKKEHNRHAALRAREAFDLAASLVEAGEAVDPMAGIANPLATALGAAIEVIAQVDVAEGRQAEAVAFLRELEEGYHGFPFHTRIRKNLLQLTLEGQPAPTLRMEPLPGSGKPLPSPIGRGRVLLFFWAHWCSDSRMQSRTLGEFLAKKENADIQLVAPARTFGYITKSTPADADAEMAHIREVLAADYPLLRGDSVQVPFGPENFEAYGASTFPTLVLTDAEGIVGMYHAGPMKLDALEAAAARVG